MDVWVPSEKWRSTHEQRLERWLGADMVGKISAAMADFPAPVPVGNVPGRVYACRGDFIGGIEGGGFASLSDLISEVTVAGKKQTFFFWEKVGVAAPAAGASQSLWGRGNWPPAGVNAAAAPGGTVFNNTQTGSFRQKDAAVGDTLHFLNAFVSWSAAQGELLMLYDYLFGVNINHATTSNSVTGVPTRYQTSATAPGNFLSGNVTTALGATAHNITVTYVDQDGNAAEAGSAQAVRVSSAVNTVPFTAPKWFYYLNAADTGLRSITNIALSAASSGNVDWFIGHALALIPAVNAAYLPVLFDGLNQAFNLERLYDGCTLALMELYKSATTALTTVGALVVVSG